MNAIKQAQVFGLALVFWAVAHRLNGQAPSDVLGSARAACIETEKGLRSARATASFEETIQEPDEKQPSLRTKGRFMALYSDGKSLVDFHFDTLIRRTINVDAPGDGKGKMLDWKPGRLVILADGKDVHVVEFSTRIHPSGCLQETYSTMREACVNKGFPFRDPVRLWKEMLDVPRTMDNLGPGAVTAEARGKTFVGQYHIKNAPQVRVEFELKPEFGFRVADYKVFNPGNVLATSITADWKESAGVWYVRRLERVDDFKLVKSNGRWSRSVCEFDSFTPNVDIAADQFMMEVIKMPPGTRHFDRRRPDVEEQKKTKQNTAAKDRQIKVNP